MVFFSVLYNPDQNAIDNVEKARENGFLPVVYVNQANVEVIEKIKDLNAVVLGGVGNVGLGKAFCEFEAWAEKNGVDRFLYFDQDTYVSGHSWRCLMPAGDRAFREEGVGLVFFTPKDVNFSRIVVSSGCMFSIDKINKVGKHDDSFFVEGVDYEFCLRLSHFGYSIRCVLVDGIDHQSLQDGNSKILFGKEIRYRCYGLSRLIDFNKSHFRLLGRSLKLRQFWFFRYFFRSLVSFNLKEFYSQICRVCFS